MGAISRRVAVFPTTATGLFESTWLQPLAPRLLLNRFYATDLPDDAINDVDWVTGACMLTRRAVVSRLAKWIRRISCF